MASEVAKKVAGTLLVDDLSPKPPTLAWCQYHCRYGLLAEAVRKFTDAQDELLDPVFVLVETVEADRISCRIPCRCFDHEHPSTFVSEVRFTLNPLTGEATRLS